MAAVVVLSRTGRVCNPEFEHMGLLSAFASVVVAVAIHKAGVEVAE